MSNDLTQLLSSHNAELKELVMKQFELIENRNLTIQQLENRIKDLEYELHKMKVGD